MQKKREDHSGRVNFNEAAKDLPQRDVLKDLALFFDVLDSYLRVPMWDLE